VTEPEIALNAAILIGPVSSWTSFSKRD